MSLQLICLVLLLLLTNGCNPVDKNAPAAGAADKAADTSVVGRPSPASAPGLRWAGIAWHTLGIFEADGTAQVYPLPAATPADAACFDCTVTASGELWYPLAGYDFSNPRLVRIDLLKPQAPTLVLPVTYKEPRTGLVPVPFNVLADAQWLYVLGKYDLNESMLTRIELAHPQRQDHLRLKADGGGIGTNMVFGTVGDRDYLAIKLNEAVAVIDTAAFAEVGTVRDERLDTQIGFSAQLSQFICLGTGQAIVVGNPEAAGDSPSPVSRRPDGTYTFTKPEVLRIAVRPTVALSATPLAVPDELAGMKLLPSGTFAISDSGTLAVSMANNNEGVAVVDLEHSRLTYVTRFDRDQLLGTVSYLGMERFALGGNLTFDARSRQLIMPTTPQEGYNQIVRVPVPD